MWHKPCRTFHPWCLCIKTRCLSESDPQQKVELLIIWDSVKLMSRHCNILSRNNHRNTLIVRPPRWIMLFMMKSSNGNIFRVTGHLCGEFTGPRWIPHTKASEAELRCFLWSASEKKRLSKQSWGWWFETLSCPLWRHCNVNMLLKLGHVW